MERKGPGGLLADVRVSWLRVGRERLAVLSVPIPQASAADPRLTDAEREVLRLVVEGRSNAEAARLRGVATRTVANQVASLLRKLGAGSRRELAVSAARGRWPRQT